MKKIKYYTVEEAKAIIEADEKLRAGLERLRAEYEDEDSWLDYGLEYVSFQTNIDDEEEKVYIFTHDDTDDTGSSIDIVVDTLEQAILIVRDIEEAQGNIEP